LANWQEANKSPEVAAHWADSSAGIVTRYMGHLEAV